jgi:hypothetical protein
LVIRRTSSQELEKISRAKLENILSCWVVNDLHNDFGFDFDVRLTEEESESTQIISPLSFYVQVKSSHKIDGHPYEDLNVSHLKLYFHQRIPVVLMKYYEENDSFYWEIIQDYALDTLNKEEKDWEKQQTKRINLQNELNDVNQLKTQLIRSQSRITKHQAFLMPIGEGIKYELNDLGELSNHRKKALLEFKTLGISEADSLERIGVKSESQKLLLDVINSPEEDITKVSAIIALVWSLNLADKQENQRIVQYAIQGIKISTNLNKPDLSNYLVIFKNQALLYQISVRFFYTLVGKRMSEKTTGGIYSIFYTKELLDLSGLVVPLVEETNKALNELREENFYFFIFSLPSIVDIAAIQIYYLTAYDKNILKLEKNRRDDLILLCEKLANDVEDANFRKIMYKSLSYYYYNILEQKKAIESLEKAIQNGELDNDPAFVRWELSVLDKIKAKSSPYDVTKPKPFSETTLKEIKEIMEDYITEGGHLNKQDRISEAIKLAIEDLDLTRVFRFCKNIYAEYTSQSALGRMLNLPSLGQRVIWCKHGGFYAGHNLQGMFDSFVEDHCKNCKFNDPQPDDWECTAGWMTKHNENPEFKQVQKNFYSAMRNQ